MGKVFSLIGAILVIALIAAFVGGYLGYKQFQPTKEKQSDIVDTRLADLQSELDQYKQKEQEEKMRKLELQQLQDPEIINQELTNVGKLIVYEGKSTYSDCLRESKWFGSKELDIELHYNFGIGIDVSLVTVKEFIDKKVVMQIPKQELKLEYIELDIKACKINGEKTLFQSHFTPDEVKLVIQNADEKTTESIINNKTIFDDALVNLKQVVENKLLELGFEEVLFEEV